MGTPELIIVFSALMALIALVTIGIDWIGRPLRNRRFIPRMYRFDDEKLPLDAYGNVTLGAGPQMPTPLAPTPLPPTRAAMPRQTALPTQPAPVIVAQVATPKPVAGGVAGTQVGHGAFSTTLAGTSADTMAEARRPAMAPGPRRSSSAGAEPSGRHHGWQPSMGLDATVDDQKPSLAVKAERFWKATGQSLQHSHFDDDDRRRMASGNSPRRTNPRTGRIEIMQLSGLREASAEADVRASWPDDSTDPWSPR